MRTDGLQRGASELKLRSTGRGAAFKCQAETARHVVSPHLQYWDAQNLLVVGASVYPHNSGFNPTGILGALALRLGDDLVDYIARPRML
jgi:choline dehydrogenase-like flavoprotein